MLDGYRVYKYYVALNLHFSSDKYDVFEKNGNVKTSLDAFERRNDKLLFAKIGKNVADDRECVQYIVANYAYGNKHLVYNLEKAKYNYKNWLKVKQSITNVFTDDIELLNSYNPDDIFRANIHIESKVILNSINGFADYLIPNVLTENKVRLIKKLSRFVKYDKSKIESIYIAKENELRQK